LKGKTPAQAAGLTDHRWTLRELLTFNAVVSAEKTDPTNATKKAKKSETQSILDHFLVIRRLSMEPSYAYTTRCQSSSLVHSSVS
jgi:hypothetical protein